MKICEVIWIFTNYLCKTGYWKWDVSFYIKKMLCFTSLEFQIGRIWTCGTILLVLLFEKKNEPRILVYLYAKDVFRFKVRFYVCDSVLFLSWTAVTCSISSVPVVFWTTAGSDPGSLLASCPAQSARYYSPYVAPPSRPEPFQMWSSYNFRPIDTQAKPWLNIK
jgi:hypothetical protein